MAIIKIDFTSLVLQRNDYFYVVSPNHFDIGSTKIVYLLHGYWGDSTDWLYLGNAREMADKYNATFIMPNSCNSFYTNMEFGERYYDYFMEVKKAFESFFKANLDPANTYIAGLSMGGYGALKIGLNNPEMFSKIGSFSGAVDIESIVNSKNRDEDSKRRSFNTYGNIPVTDTNNDLFYLIKQLKKNKIKIPNIFIYCGSTDFLYDANLAYLAYLKEKRVKHHFITDEGSHTWDRWRMALDEFLKWAK